MEQADHPVHADHQLRRAQRPALLEQQVVNVLQAQAGELAEDVHGVQHFLQVDQADFERPSSAAPSPGLQRIGRGAMAAAGVEVEEIELLHSMTIVACGTDMSGGKQLALTNVLRALSPVCTGARLQVNMRCDLHVHTRHSGMCTLPLLRHCRESYNDPLEVYEKLKRAGMDLVTVTDHDSIDAVEALRSQARLLPQRRGHLHAAQRHPTARRRLRHHRARPHRNAAAPQRFRIALRLAVRSQPVLQRQSRLLLPHRTPRRSRTSPSSNAPFPPSKPATDT